jgi:hypothetical protein
MLHDEKWRMKKTASQIRLPKPAELAKLAALLRPTSQPSEALKAAMEFYVEAVLFCREWPSLSLEDAITQFGSDERRMALMSEPIAKAVRAREEDTLELDPQKNTDAARDFLAQCGLRLKTPRAVLANIREAVNARPKKCWTAEFREHPDVLINGYKKKLNGRAIYSLPKYLLKEAADHAMWRQSESKRRGWKTRQRKSSVRDGS